MKKGLNSTKKIIKIAPSHLNNGGSIAFELGIGQFDDVSRLFNANGFIDIEIYKDLSGIERVITAKYP